MRKIFFVLMVACISTVSAQVDTFSLNNMPRDYFLGDEWLNYDSICVSLPIQHSDGTICSGLGLMYDAPFCPNDAPSPARYGFRYYSAVTAMGNSIWSQNHIINFAAGQHTDSTIRVAGISFLYPRYLTGYSAATWRYEYFSIRSWFLSNGYDVLRLQLMDSVKHILAEGSSSMEDSLGAVFLFNKDRREVDEYMGATSCNYGCGDGSHYVFYDIYEAYFPTPVIVKDSFFMAAHFEDLTGDRGTLGIAIPSLIERHYNPFSNPNPSTDNYFSPKITWFAQGGYMTTYNGIPDWQEFIYEPVDDSVWFTLDACEENHGYMLIFPILEVDCRAPEAVEMTPLGSGRAMLSWEADRWGTSWEVSYGPLGTPPGGGMVVETTTPSVMLRYLSPEVEYVAYVRAQCAVRDTVWSDWSDSIPLADHLGVGQAAEGAHVTLQPNPTGDMALLTADAALTGLEVYTSTGVFYQRQALSGHMAHVDVSTWPTGNYLLVVRSVHGTAVRRLTVAR